MGRQDISIVINVCSAGSLTVEGQVCRGGVCGTRWRPLWQVDRPWDGDGGGQSKLRPGHI